MATEKDLRNISIGNEDLYRQLLIEESAEYETLESEKPAAYHKPMVNYQSKATRCGEVRVWTREEIEMYEDLRNYLRTPELILKIMQIDGEISVESAVEALKDHPKVIGKRGLAQGITKIYKAFGVVVQRYSKNRSYIYHFIDDNWNKVNIADLMKVYEKKQTIEQLMASIDFKEEEKEEDSFSLEFKKLKSNDSLLQKQIMNLQDDMKLIAEAYENISKREHKASNDQRLDVHFYFHFGSN